MNNIPDEAVQAAKDACYEVTGNRITTPGLVEAMLEAAAPLILKTCNHVDHDRILLIELEEAEARIRELEEENRELKQKYNLAIAFIETFAREDYRGQQPYHVGLARSFINREVHGQ